MKTAMQELIENLKSKGGGMEIYLNANTEIINESLEKEKEQIINDYRNGKVNGYDAINEGASYNVTAEEYYNQTYNQNK